MALITVKRSEVKPGEKFIGPKTGLWFTAINNRRVRKVVDKDGNEVEFPSLHENGDIWYSKNTPVQVRRPVYFKDLKIMDKFTFVNGENIYVKLNGSFAHATRGQVYHYEPSDEVTPVH